MKKHEKITSVSKTNYISNKWIYVADSVEIPQYMVYKHQDMILYCKQQNFFPKTCTPHIRATHRTTNEVKFYDITFNFECEDMNDENCIPVTSKMILLVKNCFWSNKLKLQIDNDGIHTNEYLYGNTDFSQNNHISIL